MKLNENLAAAVQYNAKKQILINVVINAAIILLAMSGGVYFQDLAQDILITNFFIIMFVGGLARMEIRNWRKKNNAKGTWFHSEKHNKIAKYVHMKFFSFFLRMFVEYTLKLGAPFLAIMYFLYGIDNTLINVQTIMLAKLIYVVFVANAVAIKGGYIGTIDEKSIVA